MYDSLLVMVCRYVRLCMYIVMYVAVFSSCRFMLCMCGFAMYVFLSYCMYVWYALYVCVLCLLTVCIYARCVCMYGECVYVMSFSCRLYDICCVRSVRALF